MFEPVRLIDPGRIIVRVEALNQLICQLVGYPAFIFSVQPGAARLILKCWLFLMNPGIDLYEKRRDTFGNIYIRRFIAVGVTVVKPRFDRSADPKPDNFLSTTAVISAISHHA